MIGTFLNNVVQFLILAAVVFFLLVKPMNKLMTTLSKPAPAPAPATPEDILLLREIRDALKKRDLKGQRDLKDGRPRANRPGERPLLLRL